ncbi:MAG TPA: hypothetical protein VKJ47_13095 [Candidatus Binatia bacterium]|nr:hypothetical protein [Candidatus Binatia bacterium]
MMGHSPYRQWYAFRAKHLIVVTDGANPKAFPLAEEIAAAIATRIPESKAMAAKAKTPSDVVKLLRSHQLKVGLLPIEEALEAFQQKGKFSQDAPVPLRTLAVFGTYLLVTLEDYSRDKAQQIAKSLAEHPGRANGKPPIPFHPGAADYYEGRSSQGEF